MAAGPDLVAAALQEAKRMTLRNRWEDAANILEKAMTEAEMASDCGKIAKKLAETCNFLSGKSDSQLPKYLKLAETALIKAANVRKKDGMETDESLLRLMLLTYNNLSTFHKGKRSYHMALNYLMKALRLLEDVPDTPSPDTLQYSAKTRLNISALYADLHSYPEAITHSEHCLSTLQQELNLRLNGRLLENLSATEKEKFETMITTYVVAFYNIGVSEEAMGQGGNAAKAYRNAVKIGAKFLPPGSQELMLARAALKMPPEQVQSARSLRAIPAEEYRMMLITQLRDLGDSSPIDQSQPLVTQMETMTGTTSKSTKEPFKYYSPERLASLHARLTKGEKVEFVSADDYFMSRITSNMNVASDIKYMRPLSA
jgi:tetratricopeptide (TPR) repeat protein